MVHLNTGINSDSCFFFDERFYISPLPFGTYSSIDIIPFRLIGSQRDYLVISSDSGKFIVIQFDSIKKRFEKVHEEVYGKTGARRIVPGNFLASDPRGRAVMIGAVEKQKLVYILNRDMDKRLTVSSPLEAHKSHTIVVDCVGLDVGFDNPVFCALEIDLEDTQDRSTIMLTRYELDLGLNHVVRRQPQRVRADSHRLVTIPGGGDGPGGVIVCARGRITYVPQQEAQFAQAVHLTLPGDVDQMVVAHAVPKQRNKFFVLLQTENGDVWKVTVEPNRLHAHFLDRLAPSVSLAVMRSGFLFAAHDGAPNALYQFAGLGDPKDLQVSSDGVGEHRPDAPAEPRTEPLNLVQVWSEDGALNPLPCASSIPGVGLLIAGSGRYQNGAVSTVVHGLRTTVLAQQMLPGVAENVWTLTSATTSHTTHMVLSFANATLTLAIRDDAVHEVGEGESNILTGVNTILMAQLSPHDTLQVTPVSMRHIRSDGRVQAWQPPPRSRIMLAAAQGRQCLLGLATGHLILFELDPQGVLLEMSRVESGGVLAAVCMAPPLAGQQRSKWAAVADQQQVVRILSLDPRSPLQRVGLMQLPSSAHALSMDIMSLSGVGSTSSQALLLHCGLGNGVLMRAQVDLITGALTDSRSRFLGVKPVKLATVGPGLLLCMSDLPHLTHSVGPTRTVTTTPLRCVPLQGATAFVSSACMFGGMAALARDTLTILSVDPSAQPFHSIRCPLPDTPRKMCVHQASSLLVIGQQRHVSLYDATGQQDSLLHSVELPENASITSLCSVLFPSRGEMIAVGVVYNYAAFPPPVHHRGGALLLYSIAFNEHGRSTQLVLERTTPLPEPPTALMGYQNMLMVGAGSTLRLFDLGKKQMLKKFEKRDFSHQIVALCALGANRFVVADSQDSVFWCFFEVSRNLVRIFADEPIPRYCVAVAAIDFNTVAVSDKFGTVSILRLSDAVNEALILDATGADLWQGIPWKCQEVARFRCDSLVTSLTLATVALGSEPVLLYTTIHGQIGALVALTHREDIDFVSKLEAQISSTGSSFLLAGMSQLRNRMSASGPALHTYDGDLCEIFGSLAGSHQRTVAQVLGREPVDVMRKLDQLRKQVM